MPLTATKLVFPRFAGAGLANELFVLAKAYLAGNALGLRLVQPPWGLNRRGYGRYFYRTPFGGLGGELARRMTPTLTFSEEEYRATGLVDYGEAVLAWASATGILQRNRLAIECEGLWGGKIALERAREFIRGTLLGTRFTQANIAEFLGLRDPRKLLIGVHVRRGDFASPNDGSGSRHGRWNVGIPMEWYVSVCASLARELGERAQFAVFSDASPEELAPLIREVNALGTFHQLHTDCSDVLLMSLCDALVCSPSSYSLLAAWLSDRHYIWPAEQCWLEDGWYSLWGDEQWQRPPSGLTSRNARDVTPGDRPRVSRGVPVGADGAVPQYLLAHLETLVGLKDRRTDLIYYGVVPSAAGEPGA